MLASRSFLRQPQEVIQNVEMIVVEAVGEVGPNSASSYGSEKHSCADCGTTPQ